MVLPEDGHLLRIFIGERAKNAGLVDHIGDFDSAKSNSQGSALGNIGITQDFRAYGLPATIGMGASLPILSRALGSCAHDNHG